MVRPSPWSQCTGASMARKETAYSRTRRKVTAHRKSHPPLGMPLHSKNKKSNKKNILMLCGWVGSCAAPSLPYRQRSSVSPPDWSWASPSLALCTGCRKTLPCSQPALTWVHGTARARWQRGCALWPALIPPWLWGWRCRNWAPCGAARLGVCRRSQMPVQRKGVKHWDKGKTSVFMFQLKHSFVQNPFLGCIKTAFP